MTPIKKDAETPAEDWHWWRPVATITDGAEKLRGLFALCSKARAAYSSPGFDGIWLEKVEGEDHCIAMATNGTVLGSLQLGTPEKVMPDRLFIPASDPNDILPRTQWQRAIVKMARYGLLIQQNMASAVETKRKTRLMCIYTKAILQSIAPTEYICPDWRRVLWQDNITPRGQLCFDPAALGAYFIARYGKTGSHFCILNTDGEQLNVMQLLDVQDDSFVGAIMPGDLKRLRQK